MRIIIAAGAVVFSLLCIRIAKAEHVVLRRLDCEMLIVPASLNGVEKLALVDTGMSTFAIDERLAVDLLQGGDYQEIVSRTMSGARRTRLYENIKYQVQGLPVQIGNVTTHDLAECRVITAHDIQFVIGMSTLKNHVLSLSPNGAELSDVVLDSAIACKEFPITWTRGGVPECRVQFRDGSTVLMGVDTGLNVELTLEEAHVARLCRAGEAQRVSGFKTSKESTAEFVVVRELEVFGVVFKNVWASVAKMDAIGLPILCHLHVTLDFPNQRVLRGAAENSGLNSFPPNAGGIYLNRTEDRRTLVLTVFPDSPGDLVGIHSGDQVLAIDGTPSEKLGVLDLRARLRKAGKTVHLDLQRNGMPLAIDVPLKRPFEYPPKWPPRPEPTKDQLDFEKFLEEQSPGKVPVESALEPKPE